MVLAIRPAVHALQARGLDPSALVAKRGLTIAVVEEAEARIPYDDVTGLWNDAADLAGDEVFGAATGAKRRTGDLDFYDYLFCTSDTLGEGYRRVCQFVRVLYDQSELRFDRSGGRATLSRLRPPSTPASRHYEEFLFAYLFASGCHAVGKPWTPSRVCFRHPPPSVTAERALQPIFHRAVEFGDPDELSFASTLADEKQATADSHLNAIMTRYAQLQQDRLVVAEDDFIARVKHQAAEELKHGELDVAGLARRLRMSPRSLQRRLQSVGSSPTRIVDDVRLDLARHYLTGSRISLAEIAYLLGYSDDTAFHRAFKRLTGETPAAYRARTRDARARASDS